MKTEPVHAASDFLGRLSYTLLVLVVTFTCASATLALVIFDYTGEPNVKDELYELLQFRAGLKTTVRLLNSAISAMIIDGYCVDGRYEKSA